MKFLKTKSKLTLGCLTVFVLFAVGWTYYRLNLQWIPAGYVGIKFNARSGADRSRIYEPKAYFTGPFEQFYLYPTRIQNAVYTQDPSAGEAKSADGILITTNDTANTTFDVSVIYRIDKADAQGRVPEGVFERHERFVTCPHCRRVFWEGSHWKRMRELVDDLLRRSATNAATSGPVGMRPVRSSVTRLSQVKSSAGTAGLTSASFQPASRSWSITRSTGREAAGRSRVSSALNNGATMASKATTEARNRIGPDFCFMCRASCWQGGLSLYRPKLSHFLNRGKNNQASIPAF